MAADCGSELYLYVCSGHCPFIHSGTISSASFIPSLLPCSSDPPLFILGPGTKQVDGKHLVERCGSTSDNEC